MARVILIILDSVGIGELPDANLFGDVGANTLSNIAEAVDGFRLPHLESLGLGNIEHIQNILMTQTPRGAFGRLAEVSRGKDTTTGHWEIAGIWLQRPFPVYPEGFPKNLIHKFEVAIGTRILGNVSASGTKIIEEFGERHLKTGFPIVYTSADSVFQIAAHEAVIPIDRLYEICQIAREMLTGEHAVGRVIARPFIGDPGNFIRTNRRKDFSLHPPSETMLDLIKAFGLQVRGVGKIEDIFHGSGITHTVHTHNNMDGVDKTLTWMAESFDGLIFTNLVDFDMLYGHRNDIFGYAKALADFDGRLPQIVSAMKPDDLLMITADHGCDPTFLGTDHTREYIPLLVYGKAVVPGTNLHTRETFADIGATVLEYLGVKNAGIIKGRSFLKALTGQIR